MQLCNIVLRLGGSLLHTVPKTDVTPAEILILKRIHGDDAVVDIRPTKFDKKRHQDGEWERLQLAYDRSSAFKSSPGEESGSVLLSLFPGAMKRLPTTLSEIGLADIDPQAGDAQEKVAA